MKEAFKYDRVEGMSVPMEENRELEVMERAAELAAGLGFGQVEVDEIKLAVIEAVINAIEHGNNPENKVYISFGLNTDPRRIAIMVSDTGAGFDPSVVEEPLIEEKIGGRKRKRGWGLKIMRSLMDEVSISSGRHGTSVTIVKNG